MSLLLALTLAISWQDPGKAVPQDAAASKPALAQPGEAAARPVPDKEAKEVLARLDKGKLDKLSLAQKVEAIEQLGAISNKVLVKPLVELVKNEKTLTVRRTAVRSLARQPAAEARTAILGLLKQNQISDKPELAADLVTALAGAGYTSADWATIKRLFEQEFGAEHTQLQKAILGLVARHKEGQALELLVEHLDEPRPHDVDGAANPPAEYWERRWKAWRVWREDVKHALFVITGQRFSTGKEAKAWLNANGKKLGWRN